MIDNVHIMKSCIATPFHGYLVVHRPPEDPLPIGKINYVPSVASHICALGVGLAPLRPPPSNDISLLSFIGEQTIISEKLVVNISHAV